MVASPLRVAYVTVSGISAWSVRTEPAIPVTVRLSIQADHLNGSPLGTRKVSILQ